MNLNKDKKINFHSWLVAVSIVALAITAFGCGDDESTADSASSGPPPSKAAFAKRAEAVCGNAGSQILTVFTESQVPADGGEPAFRSSDLVPPVEEELEELRALGAPEGDEERVEEILAAMEEAVGSANEDDILTVEQFGRHFHRYDQLVTAYGVEGCAFNFA